jgi:hypothetical protein
MIKNHRLDLDSVNGQKFLFKGGDLGVVIHHVEQDQSIGRTDTLVGFMQTEPCANLTAELGEYFLNFSSVLHPFRDVNSDNNMLIHKCLLVAEVLADSLKGWKPDDYFSNGLTRAATKGSGSMFSRKAAKALKTSKGWTRRGWHGIISLT